MSVLTSEPFVLRCAACFQSIRITPKEPLPPGQRIFAKCRCGNRFPANVPGSLTGANGDAVSAFNKILDKMESITRGND